MSVIREVAAYILLISVYGFTWLVAVIGQMIPRRPWKPNGRIMVTGTFFNPNWYLSHVTPLSHCGVKEVILVVDEPQIPLERVRFVCPPSWVSKFLSRAGAKMIWMLFAGIRYRPDLYMGYHLAPGACSALVAGKLLGRPSCYQMTAGPVEIIGGGIGAIESVGGSLGCPSRLIETLALGVVRQFELVVVRGNKAKEFVTTLKPRRPVAIITGSVNGDLQSPQADRWIHLVFVGRLAPIKQVHQFIDIVDAVARIIPNVRAAIAGDGPQMADVQARTEELGLTGNIEFLGKIEDVKAILACAKVFILTSQSEGLSISMAEAMAAGVVPVVADVGELRDLVTDGVNGYLIEPDNIERYVERIVSLLQNRSTLSRYSKRAFEDAREHCSVEVITRKWNRSLREVISRASGCGAQEIMNHEQPVKVV